MGSKSHNFTTLLWQYYLISKVFVEKLLKTLERESQTATNCFKENSMIVNADRFQVIILKQN